MDAPVTEERTHIFFLGIHLLGPCCRFVLDCASRVSKVCESGYGQSVLIVIISDAIWKRRTVIRVIAIGVWGTNVLFLVLGESLTPPSVIRNPE